MGNPVNFLWIAVMFPIVFFIVLAVILSVRGIINWRKYKNSPRMSIETMIVTKRVLGLREAGGFNNTPYYATFESLSDGDRQEFNLSSGEEYGLLAEGDIGTLTFQGTKYISFERKI
ncbi:MAG: DUF2500 domain-containing protein [Oscillospiraceae bacterium]|nr:DUF2500 domain-containing protein [Oscillospiraceae bacterium]